MALIGLPQPSITSARSRTEPRPRDESTARMSKPPGLGPHCVGQRVVVRRVLPGLTGPSGGPAMTDLLGVMQTWSAEPPGIGGGEARAPAIRLAEFVPGKPGPPRPPPRLRVSAEQACLL